jgi:hypothetical protein
VCQSRGPYFRGHGAPSAAMWASRLLVLLRHCSPVGFDRQQGSYGCPTRACLFLVRRAIGKLTAATTESAPRAPSAEVPRSGARWLLGQPSSTLCDHGPMVGFDHCFGLCSIWAADWIQPTGLLIFSFIFELFE